MSCKGVHKTERSLLCVFVCLGMGMGGVKSVWCGGRGWVWNNRILLYKDKLGMTHMFYINGSLNLVLHYRGM